MSMPSVSSASSVAFFESLFSVLVSFSPFPRVSIAVAFSADSFGSWSVGSVIGEEGTVDSGWIVPARESVGVIGESTADIADREKVLNGNERAVAKGMKQVRKSA